MIAVIPIVTTLLAVLDDDDPEVNFDELLKRAITFGKPSIFWDKVPFDRSSSVLDEIYDDLVSQGRVRDIGLFVGNYRGIFEQWLIRRFSHDLYDFTLLYLKNALEICTDDNDSPLLATYDVEDIGYETWVTSILDCQKFLSDNEQLLQRARDLGADDDQIAKDFWYTRNHHGVGFWDREEYYPEPDGDTLTESAHAFGERSMIVGDDGKIYAE